MLTTISRTVGRTLLALVTLAAVATGSVLLGDATGTQAFGQVVVPAAEQHPTLDATTMPRDMVMELLQDGFTADAPTLADVTTLYGPDYIDVDETDDWVVGVYFGLGYRGDPTDGVERLYAPGTN